MCQRRRSRGTASSPPWSQSFPGPAEEGVRAGIAFELVVETVAANNVIRRIRAGTGTDGPVDTLAGSGVAGGADGRSAEAAFRNPKGIALDNSGQLWVADSDNHSIRRINLSAGRVERLPEKRVSRGMRTLRAVQPASAGPLGSLSSRSRSALQLQREARRLPVPPVRVIVADTGNNVLRRVYEDGRVETLGAASPGALVIGQGATIGKPNSQSGSTFAALSINGPEDVAADPFGTIYVTETDAKQVRALLPNGEVVAAAGAGIFNQPKGVAISQTGRLVVADTTPREIHYGEPAITSITPDRVSARGNVKITIRGRNFAPGSLLVVGGVVMTSINATESTTESISFMIPSSAEWPDNRQHPKPRRVGSDRFTHRSRAAVGIVTRPHHYCRRGLDLRGRRRAGRRGADDAGSVAVDASGNLLIADLFNHRIRRIDARTGIITSVAGNGIYGYSGDGSLAITAALNIPSAIAVDGGGNLFIADLYNLRIRRVDARTGVISTVAGIAKKNTGNILHPGGDSPEDPP